MQTQKFLPENMSHFIQQLHGANEQSGIDGIVVYTMRERRYSIARLDTTCQWLALTLFHGEQLDFETEGRVGWDDRWEASSTVGIVWGAGEACLLADGELWDALVPALDDLADADAGLEWRSAVAGRVELVAVVREGSDVVDGDLAGEWGR